MFLGATIHDLDCDHFPKWSSVMQDKIMVISCDFCMSNRISLIASAVLQNIYQSFIEMQADTLKCNFQ